MSRKSKEHDALMLALRLVSALERDAEVRSAMNVAFVQAVVVDNETTRPLDRTERDVLLDNGSDITRARINLRRALFALGFPL